MGSIFGGGGGGGGSPPKAPKLQQVDTSLTGPLYTQSAQVGQDWANLMRGSYGLGQSTAPASWEAKYLGPGALAMMGQAKQEVGAPGVSPQTSDVLTTAFGTPGLSTGGGEFGGSGAGSTWDLGGADPFKVSQNLGQQFKAPYGQLQRGQNLELAMEKQWQPPSAAMPLTGADLLNVKFGTEANAAQAQQQAFQQAMAQAAGAAGAQSAANAAGITAAGQLGAAGIKAIPWSSFGGGGSSLTGAEQGATNALGSTVDWSGGATTSPSFFGSGGG